jgi:hypothetical protein
MRTQFIKPEYCDLHVVLKVKTLGKMKLAEIRKNRENEEQKLTILQFFTLKIFLSTII